MKFCYNCGTALSGTEKFCGKCGARIEHKVQEQVTVQEQKARKCSRHGVIFTNLDFLASELRCTRKQLSDLLKVYVDMMTDADISYKVVDASDYKFVSKGAGRKSEKVSLGAGKTWIDYQHILWYNHNKIRNSKIIEHLY